MEKYETECKQCPSGFLTYGNTDKCSPLCNPGKYNNVNACIDCPKGKYTEEKGMHDCSVCPAGFFSGAGKASCTHCNEKVWFNTKNVYTNSGNSSVCNQRCLYAWVVNKNGICKRCSSNTGYAYDKEDGVDVHKCKVCPKGKQSPSGQCENCPNGRYQSSDWNYCKTCKLGTFVIDPTTYNCTTCKAGTFSAMRIDPAIGTYYEWGPPIVTRLKSCGKCPSGKSSEVGAHYDKDCFDCPRGFTSDEGSECKKCVGTSEGNTCTKCSTGKGLISQKYNRSTWIYYGPLRENDEVNHQYASLKLKLVDEYICGDCPAGKYAFDGLCKNCSKGKSSVKGGTVLNVEWVLPMKWKEGFVNLALRSYE